MREHDEKEHDQKHAGPQNAYECESAIQVNEDTARRPGVEAEADMEKLRAPMATRRGGDGGASAKNAAQAKARHVGSCGTGKEGAARAAGVGDDGEDGRRGGGIGNGCGEAASGPESECAAACGRRRGRGVGSSSCGWRGVFNFAGTSHG